MVQNDIHKMIEQYYSATLNEQEEMQLRKLLAQTDADTEDVREAKATLGLFATNRRLTGKQLAEQKPQTAWGKIKYAAIFVIGILLDLFVDIDDPIENKLTK